MKEILVIIILLLITISCELFDAAKWDEYDEWKKERGISCYRDYKGYYYCKDKDGNRY